MDSVQETDHFDSYKQLAGTMINVKFMMGKTIRKSDDDIRKSLAQGALDIIEKTKIQWRVPIKAFLKNIIKEMLKVNTTH